MDTLPRLPPDLLGVIAESLMRLSFACRQLRGALGPPVYARVRLTTPEMADLFPLMADGAPLLGKNVAEYTMRGGKRFVRLLRM